jgi:hypothetical protein
MPATHLAVQANRVNPTLELGDVNDIAERHPAYHGKQGAIRALIARAEENGLAPHIYRVGRRVLIDLIGFEQWIRDQQGGRR